MSKNPLRLEWAFGFNKDIISGVHNLSDDTKNAVFYVAAHTGVIYDYENRQQYLLQGHCNPITCCCVSEDKRWIATADSGPDSMIVVWDSMNGAPIKTIFTPHTKGVVAMDMSPDAMFIVTISHVDQEDEEQEIKLWEWTADQEGALYTSPVAAQDIQTCVHFNTSDIREIVTNGKERVIFWSWEQRQFTYYSPPLSQRDFKQAVGAFTQSIFIPDSTQAVTSTVDGDLVLWDRSLVGQGKGNRLPGDKRAVKIIRVSGSDSDGRSIWFMSPSEGYLIIGSEDGAVRFFDYQFRLVAWFEDLEAGPITSVSFANTNPPPVDPGSEDAFSVPDFIVGTKKAFIVGCEAAMFDELLPERRQGTLLVQGLDESVHGLAAHPFLPQLAVSCYSGSLQLWDYQEKRLLMVRPFDTTKLRPHCLAFDPNGRFLAVGFTNGVLKVLDAAKLDDIATFRAHLSIPNNNASLIEVRFSPDAQYMATASNDHHVAVWQFMVDEDNKPAQESAEFEEKEEWVYLGRYQSHTKAITGLEFGISHDQQALLVSVGEDKRIVEYNLQKSSVASGIHLRAPVVKSEQSATPTSCMWHPATTSNPEELIVTANDEYKMKQWNANNKTCRRTTLGPTYGGPINRLLPVPSAQQNEDGTSFVAYGTVHKVVGLMKLPFDGNPNKAMGLIAHPGEVAAIAISHDGRYMITAGGKDVTVNLWNVDTNALDTAEAQGGKGVGPYLGLIEGGEKGEFYNELVDYFYYAQLVAQGEDATETREITGRVPIERIPDLMRALGYYATEQEITNMCSEVKYSRFAETGKPQDTIGLEDFVRLYINHRPVFGLGKEQIQEAFEVLKGKMKDPQFSDGAVDWAQLQARLLKEGEPISEAELKQSLGMLVEDSEALGSKISALEFAGKILGFEDYATNDADGERNE